MSKKQGTLSPAEVQSLKDYEYKGADNSITYQMVLSPMCNVLVELIPRWVAPNVLTFISLLIGALCFLISCAFNPDMYTTMPAWVCGFISIGIFAYQTLDNLDGKQARRTRSSSPLGLLFDHGVDACNITIVTLAVAACINYPTRLQLWIFWTMCWSPFVFATWEQYCVGVVKYGIINGPTEGMILGVVLSGIPALLGPEWLAEPFGDSFPSWLAPLARRDLPFVIALPALGPTLFINIYNTIKKAQFPLSHCMASLSPFVILYVCGLIWYLVSPSRIYDTHPRWFIAGLGYLFCNVEYKMMLAHLTNSKFRPFRFVVLPLILATINALLPSFGLKLVMDEALSLYLCTGYSFLAWLYYSVTVINDITTALGIRVFLIPPSDPSIPTPASPRTPVPPKKSKSS